MLKTHHILNLVLATILIVLVFIFRSSRGLREPTDSALIPIRTTNRNNGLELSLYLPKSRYLPGSGVPVTLSVKNVGDEAAALFFSSGKKFDFAILDSNSKEIWRWSRGRVFTMAIEEIKLRKNQEVSFKAVWPQRDNAGRAVPPGYYLIRGESAASQVTKKVEARIVVESSVERSSEGR